LKNYKNKLFALIVVGLVLQNCTLDKKDKIIDNKSKLNKEHANNKVQDFSKITANTTDETILNNSTKTWEVIYLQKPGKSLSKIINNNSTSPLQFVLITNNEKSYFYLKNPIERSIKDVSTKIIDRYNTASIYRIFNENKRTIKLNLLDTTLYYYKQADENWHIENGNEFIIQGFACKRAKSKNFGTAYFSTDTNTIGGPNGICSLQGLVIKLITPDNDEFIYSSATITKKNINIPPVVPIPEKKLNEVIAKLISGKNKTISNSNRTVETKITVSN